MTDKTDKTERVCKKCSHKWLGKSSATICPKCRKYTGKAKQEKKEEEKPVEKQDNIFKVENTQTELPPIPDTISPKQEGTGEKKKEDGKYTLPSDTYVAIIDMPLSAVADLTKKPFLKLTEQEKQSLAEPLKRVCDKYIGTWFSKHTDEWNLAVTLFAIGLGKYMLYMDDLKKNPPKPKQPENTQTAGGPVITKPPEVQNERRS